VRLYSYILPAPRSFGHGTNSRSRRRSVLKGKYAAVQLGIRGRKMIRGKQTRRRRMRIRSKEREVDGEEVKKISKSQEAAKG
jgi:hypothetical protein